MGFTLEKIVPWGRSYQEYLAMFSLTEADLQRRILGCGDGPASFNAVLTERGGYVVSLDPIYLFSASQIRDRISETYSTVMEQVRNNQADFVWQDIASVEELGQVRMAAMADFLADYPAGKSQCRYITGELPNLPFADAVFDMALSSHFLFLYSAHLSADFHLKAVLEMLRVAQEVRIFPIIGLGGEPSPHLVFVLDELAKLGFRATIQRVVYEFQRGGNDMLVIKAF